MRHEMQAEFEEFYTQWKNEQKVLLGTLVAASKTSQQPQTQSSLSPSSSFSDLVAAAITHYEKYYTYKSKFAESDVLLLLSPPWISALEDAFTWVGGWRPTAAFHLLYSKSGIQFEAKFSALASSGASAAPPLDLGDLSPEQIHRIDELQRKTVAEERKISEKVAKQQERVADAEMVELSSIREEEEAGIDPFNMDRIGSTLKMKEEGFQKILQNADDLRLGTLKAIVDILSRIQGVHFLIAAAELQLKLHDWGKKREEREEASNQA